MDILSEKIVKTRKAHTCNGCYRTIPAGMNMHVQKLMCDGFLGTWRNCQTCEFLKEYHLPIEENIFVMGFAHEDKMEAGFFDGSFEDYLEHLVANFEPAGPYNKRKGFLWPKDPFEQERIRRLYSKDPSFPYPHTHTPLPGGGHVTSDRPLTLEAMEVVGKMVEHFYHKKI